MAFHPLKPETVKRVAAAHAKGRDERRADLIKRLQEKAAEHGPDSIWAEMLDEHTGPK